MQEIRAKHHVKNMQYEQFVGFGLGNACQAFRMLVMQCRFTATNTAHSAHFERLLGLMAFFKGPAAPKSQHHEHNGVCLGLQFPS